MNTPENMPDNDPQQTNDDGLDGTRTIALYA